MRHEPYPDCPGEELVREVAAEIAPPEIARISLQHISQCDHCGPLLKIYREAFSEDLSPEIEAVLQQMPSASEKARRKQAKEIAGRIAKTEPKPPSFWQQIHAWSAGLGARALAGATALALAIAGLLQGPAIYSRWQLSHAEDLVTIASSLRGTTELRVPRQENKPDEIIVKGPSDFSDWTSKPPQLIEAEGLVKRYCPKRLDAKCLELEGRISRLEGGPGSAKNAAVDFGRAVDLLPDDPRLKIELAISQFDASKIEDHPNLTTTIDLLNQALRNPKLKKEDRKVATFDLAVAYQRSELLDLAIATWNDYLSLDPAGPWRQEAEERLKKAKERIPAKKPLTYRDPKYFLQHASESSELQALEQYLEVAVRDWLAGAIEGPGSDAAQATSKLGALLAERHSDPWLKDFIERSGDIDLEATKLLAGAFSDNVNDFHKHALSKSRAAAELFSREKNVPGLLRARFEEVYALQRSLQGSECLSQAKALRGLLANTHYGWLLIQSELEQAACAAMISGVSGSKNLDASQKLNEEYRYPDLGLRIVGFEAGIEKNNRRYEAAWAKAVDGLRTYWAGSYSWERLYQFYSVLWQCAQRTQAPHASRALMMQSIRIFEESAPADSNLKAMLYLTLANNLREQNEHTLAESETNKALSLLKTATDTTAREYALTTQVEFAELELRLGKPEKALAAIEPVRDLLATGNIHIKLDFYGTLAKTYWKMGRLNEAASAYRLAVEVIENPIQARPDETWVDWLATTREIYAGLTQVLLAQADTEAALKVWERYKLIAFAPGDFPTSGIASLAATRLSVREPHLVYASFEDHLQLWVLNKDRILARSVAVSGAELQRLTNELADACKNPNTPPELLDELEHRLYSHVVQPVAVDLRPGETVVVELDQTGNSLSQLVIESLKSPQNRFFGDDYTIVYSPGIMVEERLRDPRPLGRQDPVLFVSGSGYLPGNEKEQSAVVDVFPKTLVLAGDQTTKVSIKKALTNRAALIYSGHAHDGAKGMFLAVNTTTSMGAGDFQPRELSGVRLAVLSACSSGVAPGGALDTSSLVHAFLVGGVPNVVASSWSVDSRTTADFMHRFYESLGKGESVARSLDDARRAIRAAKPHPYFWAAFSLTGRAS